jgi:hypothetical protein
MAAGSIEQDVQTFGTTTKELLALSDWLTAHAVTHVAMEATGVYWKPVWHVLDGHFELILANASHIKNVPGRKTDVNDATWIADLLAHGLIRASFVPETPIQNLRDLTRTRKQLVRERASHVQRIDKILQDANLELGSVIAGIMGTGGRAVLSAIVKGELDPEKLASEIKTRVKAPREKLVEALRGKVTSTTGSCSSSILLRPTRSRPPSTASTRRLANASRPPLCQRSCRLLIARDVA